MTRRGFLRNLGVFASALGVGLTVFKPQEKKRVVFRTAPAPDNSYLVGYKGSQFYETGIVYAPYIPLYTTPYVIAPDYIPPKFMEKYARLYTPKRNLMQI